MVGEWRRFHAFAQPHEQKRPSGLPSFPRAWLEAAVPFPLGSPTKARVGTGSGCAWHHIHAWRTMRGTPPTALRTSPPPPTATAVVRS
eukprot:CAMPEP_0171776734 /NCGR_PEP_ID=MMETSP0991-20121206/57345_1 /TAXON_ID=483369 /ORGANISM="non described non described, Strain CCMP2098" /LENGTH=87 /DNA_ID=CAMNT_0012383279 /DNA_START=175 /DNA_END=435 /DNA_ORIENTATION=+